MCPRFGTPEPVSAVTGSFNTMMEQMTEMPQQKKPAAKDILPEFAQKAYVRQTFSLKFFCNCPLPWCHRLENIKLGS